LLLCASAHPADAIPTTPCGSHRRRRSVAHRQVLRIAANLPADELLGVASQAVSAPAGGADASSLAIVDAFARCVSM